MARQIASKSIVDSRQSAAKVQLVCRRLAVFAIAVILTGLANLQAESVASKNKEGNRLFAQGKYEDAEKAYLEAQVNSPGRSEVLYNLGNSLIKQKKYDRGMQALRQSMSKGDKGIKENSWYNSGNAMFSIGKFKDSAEAFIQALKLDPADKDAKHNLELALMQLKQQEQKQSNADQKQQNSQKQNQDRSQTGKKDQPRPNEPVKPQTAQAAQREGSISKEQALQILEALQSREIEEQRKLLERRARQKLNAKDW